MAEKKLNSKSFETSVKSFMHKDDKLEVSLRITNNASKALHYIADVRATRYDPETKTLSLCMSDEGRQVVPGAISKLPVFRFVEPGSEAELTITVPDRIVKLSRNSPPEKIAFETYSLTGIENLIIEVAWADVPYYTDARPRALDDDRLPAVRWEQFKAKATKKFRSKKSKGK